MAKYLLVLYLFFFISPLKSEIIWADKLIGFSSQRSGPAYGASQAIGKPSITSEFGLSECAWQPEKRGRTNEWIRLGFSENIYAEMIVIHENINPGAITRIVLYDSLKNGYQVYSNNTPIRSNNKGKLNFINIPRTDYKVHEIKVEINLSKYLEEYQIDAVGIADKEQLYKIEINSAKDTLDFKPENLGIKINSYARELVPVISANDSTLFFVRNGHSKNLGDLNKQDIWYSKKDRNGEFQQPVNIDFPVNNIDNNFIISIMPDGNTIIVGNKYFLDGTLQRGLSRSNKTKSGWSFPDSMHIINYYNNQRLASYSVSSSGKVLLMSVERNDSYGLHDIYVSFLIDDDIWSEPKNLGQNINTAASEITPFLASDERTLYFSTSGRPGYGLHDMFVTKRLDESWTNWSEPLNLGPRLNSAGWDAYYTIPASGNYAYFVSSENSIGQEDIFRIKLQESIKPESVILVSGRVYNAKTNEPIEAKIIYEDLQDGKEVGIAKSDPETGKYSIVLPSGKKYGFLAEEKGFVAQNENIDLTELDQYKEINRDLYLVPIEKGQKVRLNNIFFDFAEYQLLTDSYSELNRIVSFLNENPTIKIKITGYTDNKGTAEINMQLSQARANAVADYLTSKKISTTRIIVVGKGSNDPVASNNTEEGRQKNRRVEFEIISD